MAFRREERIADEVKRVVADLIRTELEDPDIPTFTSITGVEVSKDYAYADLYVSVLASTPEKKQKAVEALNGAKNFLRNRLFKQLNLREAPELRFHLDNSYEEGQKIDRLLDQVKSKSKDEE